MPTKDPRIDAKLAKAGDFAKPIFKRLRDAVHKACPQCNETLKWSHPSFEFPKGQILCGFAAFKAHCTFGFWKDRLLRTDDESIEALDALGRMETANDLPAASAIAKLVKRAAKLNEEGVKVPKAKKPPKAALPTPKDFAAALKKTKSASIHFEAFSPSKKRDYIEWIVEAKTDETRKRRLETAIEWIAEGKARHWKYESK